MCSEGKWDSCVFFCYEVFLYFRHEALMLRFFCYCLVSFIPMLILHSFVLACFFLKIIFFYFDRLVLCILIKHRYYLCDDDFSAFDVLALRLASELWIPS